MSDFVIFVEGLDDKALVEAVLAEMGVPFEVSEERRGVPVSASGTVRYSGGWASLSAGEAAKWVGLGKKVLVIFDADADAGKRRAEIVGQGVRPDGTPYNSPTVKSKVREYAAAVDAGVWEHQGYRKCFANKDVWNYSAAALEPLKAFLRRHVLPRSED